MSEVPRRLPRTPAGRSKNVAATHASLSGDGQSKVPRPVAPNPRHARIYNPNEVVVGDTGGESTAVAISLTRGHGAKSTATAVGAVAIGNTSSATVFEAIAIGEAAQSLGSGTVAIGAGSHAIGDADPSNLGTVAIGSDAQATGAANLALGEATRAIGSFGVIACGAEATCYGDGSMALGRAAAVGTPTVPVTNTIAIGTGVSATVDNQLVLGNSSHAVIVNGKLVLADNLGGLHQIVVAPGGALSTVAYP